MDHTDFCVIGNGAVGMLTAVELTKSYPDKKITLIGPFSQTGSASVAAGLCTQYLEKLKHILMIV